MVEQESTREEGWSMAQGIWSTDSVADSRTGTDVRFDQFTAHFSFRSKRNTLSSSSGNGASKTLGSFPPGSMISSLYACKKWRSSSTVGFCFPYTLSPTMGQPRKARCSLIWCVRPVSGWTSSSVGALKHSSVRYSPAGVDVRFGCS